MGIIGIKNLIKGGEDYDDDNDYGTDDDNDNGDTDDNVATHNSTIRSAVYNDDHPSVCGANDRASANRAGIRVVSE